MRTVFILMDSLNRHYLPAWGGWIRTPNMDRLAEKSVVFDGHFCGSMPCIPARREMMTGRLNFLEAPWGPIEPWDVCLPPRLQREKNVYSHMVTDHFHYFHSGGEGYQTLFSSWEFERGQAGDAWRPVVTLPAATAGRGRALTRGAYWRNRSMMDTESDLDYPTPRCFERAVDFIERNHQADDWHLHLEVFDPHEPFDCPKKYRDLFHDAWDRGQFTWPDYARLDPKQDDQETVDHIRRCYAGTLFMADHWLGKLFDALDRHGLWSDTAVLLSSDHGHLLGEHGYWAKNYMQCYAELARIPLMAHIPGVAPRREKALTASMDLAPTLLDLHGCRPFPSAHGRSLLPLVRRETDRLHDGVLYGYFGSDVNATDGRYTYCRQPIPGGPVHHYTAMPRGFSDFIPRDILEKAEAGRFLPAAGGIPHWRITTQSRRHADAPEFHPLYDLEHDPVQERPLHDKAAEGRMTELMKRELIRCEAPAGQMERLGLSG